MSRYFYHRHILAFTAIILCNDFINNWIECRINFPQENEHKETTTNNKGSDFKDSEEKWDWSSTWNGWKYGTGHENNNGSWRWVSSERAFKYPTIFKKSSHEIINTNNQHYNFSEILPKWPRSSVSTPSLMYNQIPSQFQYANNFTQNQTRLVRFPYPLENHIKILPPNLQNYYIKNYGNNNNMLPSGSSPTGTMMGWSSPYGHFIGPGGNNAPKHLYYGRPRGELQQKKRVSLEIHPAYLVAPVAGLAAFGLVSKLISSPVLLELGLVDKDKDGDSGDSKLTHHHQHQHQHHHHKPTGSQGGPGWIGVWPVPIASYPASASATAVASSSSSSSSGGMPSMMSTSVVTDIPIILGNNQFRPTIPSESPAPDPRPWWSPFAAMIPRLRLLDGEDPERDR